MEGTWYIKTARPRNPERVTAGVWYQVIAPDLYGPSQQLRSGYFMDDNDYTSFASVVDSSHIERHGNWDTMFAPAGAQKPPLAGSTPAKLDAGKPPVYQGFMAYFPRAIKAVSHVSVAGREKYQAEWEDKAWMTLEVNRLLDGQSRHMLDRIIHGEENAEDSVHHPTGETLLHLAQNAWEAMAALEVFLKEREEVDG